MMHESHECRREPSFAAALTLLNRLPVHSRSSKTQQQQLEKSFWATVTFTSPDELDTAAATATALCCVSPTTQHNYAAEISCFPLGTAAAAVVGVGDPVSTLLLESRHLPTCCTSFPGGLLLGTEHGRLLLVSLEGGLDPTRAMLSISRELSLSAVGVPVKDVCSYRPSSAEPGGSSVTTAWAMYADGSLCSFDLAAAMSGTLSASLSHARWTTPVSMSTPLWFQVVPLRRMPLFDETWEVSSRTEPPGLEVVIAATQPCLASFRPPPDNEAAVSLGHLAAAAATSLSSSVQSMARELHAIAPTGIRSLFRGGKVAVSSVAASFIDLNLFGEPAPKPRDAAAAAAAEPAAAPLRAPTQLELDVEFRDEGRHIRALLADPDGRLLLATDGGSRVLLLDALDLTVLRYWKGYRNAQIAWMRGGPREELFAVIFAPRRRQVELWSVMGPRACVLKVDVGEGARLIYHAGGPPLGSVDAAAAAADGSPPRVFIVFDSAREDAALCLAEVTLEEPV